MPITSNIDLVTSYDLNIRCDSGQILGGRGDAIEFAGQCVAIEVLRGLLSDGLTVEEWNNMGEPEPWTTFINGIRDAAVARARLNVVATVPTLTANDIQNAVALGGSYFEDGYTAVMANIGITTVHFTKYGGI